MVLFLFVIMLLGAEQLRPRPAGLTWQTPLAIILGLVLVVEFGYRSVRRIDARWRSRPAGLAAEFGSLRAMGQLLFNQLPAAL